MKKQQSNIPVHVQYKTVSVPSNRLDEQDTIFFERELEHVKEQTYDAKFPRLKFAEGDLIPISFEAGEGARSITYETFTMLGIAKIISDYADDLPRGDVKGKETTVQVRDLGSSFGWNIREIKAARRTGKSLEPRKSQAARRAIFQLLDKIAAFGDQDSGLLGLLTHPNITEVVLPADGTGSSTKLKDKTPDKILRDLNAIPTAIVDSTNGIESPDTMLMPHAQHELIANTPRSIHSDVSIKEWFLRNNEHIKEIIPVVKMKGADSGEDVIVCYEKNPQTMTLEIPDPFEILPGEQRGLEMLFPTLMSTGGVVIYYPLSVAKAVGA
jgi:hypothetical protein